VSPSFEWDPAKDAQNQRKHGVAFVEAQLAFLDPGRVVAKDVSHSIGEPRFIASERPVAACSPYVSPTAVK
jgi:uncharacterized DUF497 family protein